MKRTKRLFGLKGRQPAFVGRAWFCPCKTTAAFLQTSPTSLWAPRCLPWQSQTVYPAAEIWKTFRRFPAFAANAQQPPCHRACRPTLCWGTARWRRSQELFDTASSLGICMNGFSFCQLHYFVRRSGSAPQQAPLSAFQPPCLGRTTPAFSLVQRAPQEIFHRDTRQRQRIFEKEDSQPSVKVSGGLQGV